MVSLRRSAALLAFALFTVATRPAWAAGNPSFPMIGLASGQTLRLNVVAFPPDPCIAQIGFLTRAGIQPQPDPGKTVTLQPGQSDFVDLSAADLGLSPGQRVELQPVVTLVPQPEPTVPACAATVELFTTGSGATAVTVPQPDPGVPNVAPTFGLVGIALGQVLRLNVVAYPPDPCIASIGFMLTNGQPVPVPDKTVTLAPGTGAFIDLGAALLGLQTGQRAEVLPVVALLPGPDGVSSCQADVEIYSRRTGRTRAVLTPQPEPN